VPERSWHRAERRHRWLQRDRAPLCLASGQCRGVAHRPAAECGRGGDGGGDGDGRLCVMEARGLDVRMAVNGSQPERQRCGDEMCYLRSVSGDGWTVQKISKMMMDV